jgi:hypothetical protein
MPKPLGLPLIRTMRSASTLLRVSACCTIPFLSGCLLIAGANLLTGDPECDAIRSDRERGVVSTTAWREKHCEEVEQARLDEAKKIVQEANKQNGRPYGSETLPHLDTPAQFGGSPGLEMSDIHRSQTTPRSVPPARSQPAQSKDAAQKSGPCQRTDRGLICREESNYSLH